jgi:hypothetical protein
VPYTSPEAEAPGAGPASVRTTPPRVHPARAIAFRVAAHSLDVRRSRSLVGDVLGACGMPDVPAGSANLALHARLHRLDRLSVPAALRSGDLYSVWGPRRMPHIVEGPDVLVFGLGALPDREDALRTALGADEESVNAAGLPASASLAMVAGAITETLRQGPMAKEELSGALHGRLPLALEPWCGACRSNHVPESLFRMGTTAAGAISDGGSPERFQVRTVGLADVPGPHLAAARIELVRRFLRCFGPSTPEAFASWAGTGVADALRRWHRLARELVEMDLDGPVWLLRESIPMLREPPPMRGVRLLPGGDPFLQQRDRATLLPDFDSRRRLWRPSGGPGLTLLDGEPVGLWRARWGLRRIEVRLEPLRRLTTPEREEVAAETQRLAEFQGLAQGVLSLT